MARDDDRRDGVRLDAVKHYTARSAYQQYGDKSEAIWTAPDGRADFLADSGAVSLWLEDGVGLI
jgi:hypothetical protein